MVQTAKKLKSQRAGQKDSVAGPPFLCQSPNHYAQPRSSPALADPTRGAVPSGFMRPAFLPCLILCDQVTSLPICLTFDGPQSSCGSKFGICQSALRQETELETSVQGWNPG